MRSPQIPLLFSSVGMCDGHCWLSVICIYLCFCQFCWLDKMEVRVSCLRTLDSTAPSTAHNLLQAQESCWAVHLCCALPHFWNWPWLLLMLLQWWYLSSFPSSDSQRGTRASTSREVFEDKVKYNLCFLHRKHQMYKNWLALFWGQVVEWQFRPCRSLWLEISATLTNFPVLTSGSLWWERNPLS